MTVYWFLFGATFLALLKRNDLNPRRKQLSWVLLLATIAFIVGSRHNVGGDWGSYVVHFRIISGLTLLEAVQYGDPAYTLVNWAVAQFSGSIYTANLICAVVFCYGLGVFCSRQPQPWLALLIAIPYLVIVVAMGYTRQSAAIALMMVAFARIEDQRIAGFLTYAILAALFHKSALVMVPLAALSISRGRIVTLCLALGVVVAGYFFLLAESADTVIRVYITDEYKASEGGPVRVMMNALPGLIFLLFRRRFGISEEALRLWTILSLTALAAVPAVFVLATATDRLSLYLIPLQIFVLSRLKQVFGSRNGQPMVFMVVLVYAAVQFVWLTYGVNAKNWLPYQSYLFLW